ncbi:MAG: hypothetical protein IKH34_09595 [Oscillospiraceae bacterium]|nr:hypothetical protein [Oscillospiraceae bacterium]
MGKRRSPEQEARRQRLILLGALLLMLAANLRPVYGVSVAGRELPGRYARRQTERCAALARKAAEEILGTAEAVPTPELHLHLSLRPAAGDEAVLTDALLCSTEGVAVSDEVRVNGTRLGTVADREALRIALDRSIRRQMPMAAVSGSIRGHLEYRRVYTRAGGDTPLSDMVLLITGMAPVVYVDADGKLA